MTPAFHHACERSDRVLIGAFLLLLITAGAAIASNPYTDYIPADSRAELAKPVKLTVAAPSPGEIATMKRLAERRCLAEAMYYEARGEGVQGEEAVAEVVFNRMRSGAFPSTVCGVVYEGANLKHACQFSFTCNGELRRPKNARAWTRANFLAAKIMMGALPLSDLTDDATSYHAVDVQPGWADQMERTVQIGNHVFYREAARSRSS
ncbi:MAG TPA: cell wall hydrolase [Rhizomicrobium sp.]|nr:cell wall hydrolase [Rhizomicrobium sp.]